MVAVANIQALIGRYRSRRHYFSAVGARTLTSMVNLMPQHRSVLSSGIFIVVAVLAFVYHMANGDIDGSGLVFFLMTAPWGWALPDAVTTSAHWDVLAYPVAWIMIVTNAVVIGLACHYWRGRRRRGRDDVGVDSPY